MLNWIKQFWPAKSLNHEQPLNFHELAKEELVAQYPNALHDLYTGKEDGFLVKGVLSPEQVAAILANFQQVLDDEPAYTNVGFTYPTIFAEFSNRILKLPAAEKAAGISAYFAKNDHFSTTFKDRFGVGLPQLLNDLFQQIGGGRKVRVPKGMEDQGHYPFATFRYLVPATGMMAVHCGNYFQDAFLKVYQHLSSIVKVKNQMSFFIVLQAAEAGGELSVFNFRWKDGQSKINPSEDREIYLPNGKAYFIDEDKGMQKIMLKPQAGDMILFQGGSIWHRVEPVRGQQNRITFGGFMGFSEDEGTLYYWS
ncbi:MAG: hypothetical protein DA408_10690 [Bacteroidetes bacterium]|nr:MAG: hypothetical protein C7N36_07905 [Bacteroidota bacterium]PTM12421.1 MAG: hypothetical protein DA408_10690 [Bacteroidota bacterium]